MTDVTVAEERPDQSEVGELLAQSDAFLFALYPPEHQRRQPTVAALLGDDVHFLVARRDGKALGCMALMRTGQNKGELRRCFVTEAARGQRERRADLRRRRNRGERCRQAVKVADRPH